MKTLYAAIWAVFFAIPTMLFGQEEGDPDTTRMTIGKTTIIIVESEDEWDEEENHWEEGSEWEERDPNEEEPRHRSRRSEAHWAGVDFGFNMLMDNNFNNSFSNAPYWKNDPARSQVWNLNILEHKFNFGTPYVGFTTGLGFSFTSIAFNNNYVLQSSPDSLIAVIDTAQVYEKNKLKASYLTIPLMLEFNTSANENRSFYLAAGVVGGVRLSSKIKRTGDIDGKRFKEKIKGRHDLNAFKLDAAVRLGYGDWGVFANYSLLPLFDKNKTVEVYPLTFGLSLNF